MACDNLRNLRPLVTWRPVSMKECLQRMEIAPQPPIIIADEDLNFMGSFQLSPMNKGRMDTWLLE